MLRALNLLVRVVPRRKGTSLTMVMVPHASVVAVRSQNA
jgi:hypothetical protein